MIFQRYKLKANHNRVSGYVLPKFTVDDISKIQTESKSQHAILGSSKSFTVDDISKIQTESKSQHAILGSSKFFTVDDISKIQTESKSQP